MSGRRIAPPILEHEGQQHTLYEWSHITGIPIKLLRERLARGWSVEETLTVAPGQGRPREEFCKGCRYQGRAGVLLFCDYLSITGHPRTVRHGKKVELCPRKRGGKDGCKA